ncbi:MAG: DUF1361 domain-containing protein [Saprospiraceae bacterium]|nr:DUF1361 domain-containing protein [Saprospiraceae bacterium]
MIRAHFRDRRQFNLFGLLVMATALNALLLLGRAALVNYKTHPAHSLAWPEIQGLFGLAFGFLGWNLFLAWVPYLAALRFERSGSRLRWAWFLLWLLFLPNAPYIVTDFIHLHHRPPVPVWYDMVMLFSFASTGLMLGLLSLYEIRLALGRQWSRLFTESIMCAAIGLAGFGVWLGRFQRWNSWDVFSNPAGLLRDLLHTVTQRHELIDALGVSGLIGAMLLMGYAMLSVMLSGGRSNC